MYTFPFTPLLKTGLSFLSLVLLIVITSCSKKTDSPKLYGQTTTLFHAESLNASIYGTGAAPQSDYLGGIAVDGAGYVYVFDNRTNQIRKISSMGVVATVSDDKVGSVNIQGIQASISLGLAIDNNGNLYASYSYGSIIRKITPDGKGSIIAGDNVGVSVGDVGVNVINEPFGLAVGLQGNLYVADLTRIKKIYSGNLVTTLAGNGFDGFQNGDGANAEFNSPSGVAVDAAGNVYVADAGNSLIRKITASGLVTTFAGSGKADYADGNSTSASFNHPCGVAVDFAGNLYVADSGNHMIRKITPEGQVTTLAGSMTEGSSDGIGTAASFSNPCSVALNSQNTLLYVVDRATNLVRQITIK